MGLFNNDDYNKKLEEIEESFREERRNAFEKDLSEFDFSMPLSKATAGTILPTVSLSLVMMIRYVIKPVIYANMTGEKLTLNKLMPVIMSVLLVLVFIFAAIFFRCAPMPEVKGEFFRYKKEDFHCSDINQIKVSRIRIITVYLSNGKKIRITRDYENYETFLVWAEKCGIDIDRAVDYGDDVGFPQDLDPKTAAVIIALIVMVVVVVLYFSLKT